MWNNRFNEWFNSAILPPVIIAHCLEKYAYVHLCEAPIYKIINFCLNCALIFAHAHKSVRLIIAFMNIKLRDYSTRQPVVYRKLAFSLRYAYIFSNRFIWNKSCAIKLCQINKHIARAVSMSRRANLFSLILRDDDAPQLRRIKKKSSFSINILNTNIYV